MISKVYLYGGGAVVALLAGYMLLSARANAASSDPSASADSSGLYSQPVVYGTSGTTSADGTSTSSTTDDSISQVIAGQLAQAQLQSTVSLAQIASDKEVALAGYDNTLAVTKDKDQAAIEQSLAGQLGNIVNSFVTSTGASHGSTSNGGLFGGGGSKSGQKQDTVGINNLTGTIGFTDGVISLNLSHSEPGIDYNSILKFR